MDAPVETKKARDAHASTVAPTPGELPIPASSRYLPGATLCGKYRLEAILGEGGMGSVWRASNLLLDLPVAIKLIRADLDRSTLRARLQVEARSAAKLGHPAIVRVYDVGESELGDPFIVMELMHGETLAQMISQGRLSSARAVQILLPIIDALAVAHARGIVHRDLKPDNIMLAREQQRVQPKILDFGIAKLTDPRDSDHKLTEIGMIVGSPDYMSPEQARGRDDVDASSDIWAICVVLYEAVTGVTPFAASNYNALLRAIVEDAPRSLLEHAAGDGALWSVVQRGLSKERAERQSSMSELGRELGSWLVSHGVFEDACGTSIESQWLGRSSAHPASLHPGAASARAISTAFQPKASASRPNGTGIDSPPFTATIPAHPGHRARTVSAAVAACALLGVLMFGFVHRSSALAGAPLAGAPLAGAPMLAEALTTLATVPSALAHASEPAATFHGEPPPSAPVEAPKTALTIQAPPRLVKPVAPGAPAARLAAPSAKAWSASVPAASASPAPAAKPAQRPLDLLAPY
jgi:serine/threonine protein kinase